jgi:uncharacterized SAM-binding protein YcdF (DUF218 family)
MATDNATFELAQCLWNYLHLDGPLDKSDCIIGLGSYDLRVAERCADLLLEGWAPLIIFSGHLGNWTSQIWEQSEAEIFAQIAVSRGVPAEHIKLETRSANIGENIRFTRDFMRSEGIHARRITMVSKPSTERRMFATCRKIWPAMDVRFTSPRLSFAEQMAGGIGEGLIHEMVGDIQRIREYPALGFQVPQEIPAPVWDAFEKLVSLGFDRHLIAG